MQHRDQTITTLIFDWDGTLVDSAELGLLAFQRVFADLGVSFPDETYQQTYSPNWYSIYEAVGLPRDKWQTADALWNQHYGNQAAQLVAGAAETIVNLHAKGYRLGVVTSGTESRVRREIAGSLLRELFEVVICNEHIVNKKPHPEGLELALKHLTCSPVHAAYVGDAPEDIEMGKRAGVLTVGVRSNYPTSLRLQGAKPHLYLESLSELTCHF